ncbi:MAG: energy transducer TonB [Ignavibacteriales bacterium]|nr:energy transducer TonB [Ignavibacteriales bacterium]
MYEIPYKYFSSIISFVVHSLLILFFYFVALHSLGKSNQLIEFHLDSGSSGEGNSFINKSEKAELPKKSADEFINTKKINVNSEKLSTPLNDSGTKGTGTGDGTGTENKSGISPSLLIPPKPKVEEIYLVAVDEMPEPIGGMQKIISQVVYPAEAKRNGVAGTVFVLAFVDENGSVRKTLLTKGIGGGCDEAALRAVSASRFKPGKDKGRYAKVQIQIPVPFKLY